MFKILYQTSIWDSLKDTHHLGHGVNTSGVMGAGVALAIKRSYPNVFETYRNFCYKNGASTDLLGQVITIPTDDGNYIHNIFTQELHKRALPCAIELGLIRIKEHLEWTSMTVVEITFPAIGCGLGTLHWEADVQPIFERVFGKTKKINAYVCMLKGRM